MIDLSGRVVVVTGGNSGIGLGIARGVARAGASVAIWSRRAIIMSEARGKNKRVSRVQASARFTTAGRH